MEKKSLKKLSLNKEEIVNLNDNQMNNLRGGAEGTVSIVTKYISEKIIETTISITLEKATDYVIEKVTEWLDGDDDDYVYNGSTLPEVIVTPAPIPTTTK